MPRGGGFRGGSFRGGGLGGGFRGGGFRGGPASFRTGGIRPSGVPFGRTGATRIVSRSPSGPYRHTYYHPHPRYYWWGYRPWYWRWWYSPWWSGYWYRPWYYSPVYIGGGIIFFIILGLILLPIFGIGLWYPFSAADSSGTVNYRSTETIYFNEYWYEHEYTAAGNSITYSVQSSPSLITFAIWDQPFENLPTKNIDDSFIDSFTLIYNQFEYYWLFLRPDSVIFYDFTADAPVDFFIADANQLYNWNQGGTPSFYEEILDTTNNTGSIIINQAQDYYLVWYNDEGGTINVDFAVNYTAADVIDFSGAYEVEEGVNTVSGVFNVPDGMSGDWYFFIYFDPLASPEESTTITFDVTYDTGLTYADRWLDVQWILIIIAVIIVIIIIAAVIARRGQKKLSLKAKKEQKAEPTKAEPKEAVKEIPTVKSTVCPRCGSDVKADSIFCPQCGGKLEGRSIGTSKITTPAEAKTCSFCGSKLSESANYCPWCGTPKS